MLVVTGLGERRNRESRGWLLGFQHYGWWTKKVHADRLSVRPTEAIQMKTNTWKAALELNEVGKRF